MFRSVWLHQQYNKNLKPFVTELAEEIETEIKAVWYDITSMNGGQALSLLKKMRRMLKAMEGKVKTLVKVCGRNQGKFRTEKGN